MRKIAFWSLYEAPERTDHLVETVKKLISLEKNACVIDANVYSPELFRKLSPYFPERRGKRPLVEYMLHAQDTGMMPGNLGEYLLESENLCYMGSIYESLYRAGELSSALNWNEFFPDPGLRQERCGINLFSHLMYELNERYSPSHILLNTAPGISLPSIDLCYCLSDSWFCLRSGDQGEKNLFKEFKSSITKAKIKDQSGKYPILVTDPNKILES